MLIFSWILHTFFNCLVSFTLTLVSLYSLNLKLSFQIFVWRNFTVFSFHWTLAEIIPKLYRISQLDTSAKNARILLCALCRVTITPKSAGNIVKRLDLCTPSCRVLSRCKRGTHAQSAPRMDSWRKKRLSYTMYEKNLGGCLIE